jgi:hypothetical protein
MKSAPTSRRPRLSLVNVDGRTMVHRTDCHMANRGGGQPWEWANNPAIPDEVVRRAIIQGDYRVCRTCKPIRRFT